MDRNSDRKKLQGLRVYIERKLIDKRMAYIVRMECHGFFKY